jgi:hypothetical protein
MAPKPAKRLFSPAVKRIISARAKAKRDTQRQQQDLLEDRELNKLNIESKLRPLLDSAQFANFERCGQEKIIRTCKCCGRRESFTYRCSIKWCPMCNWRITDQRRIKIRAWLKFVTQPKHLVLTQRNFPVLTRRKIRAFVAALAKLRRNKIFADVDGGCASVEITNDGNGWHLHAHLLLNARWLDMKRLSIVWGHLVGQEFGIVKIKDCRDAEFLQEVSKYVVKGSTMAAWPAEWINEFVRAIKGLRFFFAFGSLFKLRDQIREILDKQKSSPVMCECGSDEFMFKSEVDEELESIQRDARSQSRKSKVATKKVPPRLDNQLKFPPLASHI